MPQQPSYDSRLADLTWHKGELPDDVNVDRTSGWSRYTSHRQIEVPPSIPNTIPQTGPALSNRSEPGSHPSQSERSGRSSAPLRALSNIPSHVWIVSTRAGPPNLLTLPEYNQQYADQATPADFSKPKSFIFGGCPHIAIPSRGYDPVNGWPLPESPATFKDLWSKADKRSTASGAPR